MAQNNQQHSALDSVFPVFLPQIPQLHYDKVTFEAGIKTLLQQWKYQQTDIAIRPKNENATGIDNDKSLRVDVVTGDEQGTVRESGSVFPRLPSGLPPGLEWTTSLVPRKRRLIDFQMMTSEGSSLFMNALLNNKSAVPTFDQHDGKMLTQNGDIAYRTSGQPLVDAFFEIEDAISATRLKKLLNCAWETNKDATLKIIWNARSIHLGKGSRVPFYRAVGWLAEYHPETLLINLPWLVRPIIRKKVPAKVEKSDEEAKTHSGVAEGEAEFVDSKDAESDFELIDVKEGELKSHPSSKKLKLNNDGADDAQFDIKYGVSHGYWKDLLNILALAANEQLKVDGDVTSVLNIGKPSHIRKDKRDWTENRKQNLALERHDRILNKLENDGFYKALHLTVARLFAAQLKTDLYLLKSGDKREKKSISLAAKWAPSQKGMHDSHTCIVSSIAELLYPFDTVCPAGVDPADRTLYLKYARMAYQVRTLSPLRKFLEVVERPITAERFDEIKYERVPSLAMKQYANLFASKDFDEFEKYIDNVASGKTRISGATLLPSVLVNTVSQPPPETGFLQARNSDAARVLLQKKMWELKLKATDAQWKTLVQRIKDSGTIESSIAVCDVSGSMAFSKFRDGTYPMDSAIGLSLLLAEITQPPFGGALITFSEIPQVMHVGFTGDNRSLQEKVEYIREGKWGMNTNFGAVFEDLILPMAIENGLKQEDMVKQVFVFSDMQFDSAAAKDDRWTTSYERIKKKYKKAGFEMPRLIFWNLDGGRSRYGGATTIGSGGDESYVAPKPVTAAEEGTVLVSGYSQGQMKMFLDNGSFEEPIEEEVIEEKEGENDEVVIEKKKNRQPQDSLAAVEKAISHDAYKMLKVVD